MYTKKVQNDLNRNVQDYKTKTTVTFNGIKDKIKG